MNPKLVFGEVDVDKNVNRLSIRKLGGKEGTALFVGSVWQF